MGAYPESVLLADCSHFKQDCPRRRAQIGFLCSASSATLGQLAIDDHRRDLADAERESACRYSAVALFVVVSLPVGLVGAGVGAGCGLRGRELDCRQP
jgi:hypothetical protein